MPERDRQRSSKRRPAAGSTGKGGSRTSKGSASSATTKRQRNSSSKNDSRDKGQARPRFLARWFLVVPVVLAIFLAIAFSWHYEPAKILYRDVRNERVKREKLARIEEYNEELRQELASLETTEGIMAYAARELNFVVEGDHVIVVTRDGKPITEPRNTREQIIASIPETARPFGAWTDFLDTIFGFRGQQ
ncbi:MAG: hypothetical protein FWE46_03800 [Coriobacteriia bacterium]|nr:hypothetical protein [Coriobacteriia bacterium]MCL2537400.1 hypothetical protein [Coriobacteriia bacterium]